MIWDAIVVGAGPAGSSTASRLADAGLTVALLDRAVRPRPAVCGEFLSPGCQSLLADLGVLSLLRKQGRTLNGIQIHAPSGEELTAHYPRAAAPALSLRRSQLDPVLLEAAVCRGTQFFPGHQVSDVLFDDGAVQGVRAQRQGREVVLRGRLVVGADGRHSVVARRLGLVATDPRLDKLAFIGYVERAERQDDCAEIFLGRQRYAILNPVAPDLTNVGLVLNRREFRPGVDPACQFLEAAATIPGLMPRLEHSRLLAPPRCLGPLAYRAQAVTASGAALVGDAAGFLDPFTGEGIHAGLRGGKLLARTAVRALETAESPVLRTYATAWRQQFLPKWRLCMLFQHAIHRPVLAAWLVARLGRRPRLLERMMAVVGDLASPASLRPEVLYARLLMPES